MPDRSRSDRADTSAPAMCIVPAVGRSSVPITFNNVDLPDPDGPTTATNSPDSTRRSIPARAGTGGFPG